MLLCKDPQLERGFKQSIFTSFNFFYWAHLLVSAERVVQETDTVNKNQALLGETGLHLVI